MKEITKVYVSPFLNIFQNLCLEDYFLRTFNESFVLFYINDPCVVMGKFQNPWRETNPQFLNDNEISLARRQSGGGCVYHDQGNLNFCFFRKKNILTEADKEMHLSMIRSVLESKNITTSKLPKSGMTFESNGQSFKFSGEAFKQTASGSFHHGTLLINSDLEKLEKSIKGVYPLMDTKAVKSNPYQVGNLCDVWPELTALTFIIEFNSFHKLINQDIKFLKIHQYVTEHAHKLATKEHVFFKTPNFEMTIDNTRYHVRKGRVFAIDDVEVEVTDFPPA